MKPTTRWRTRDEEEIGQSTRKRPVFHQRCLPRLPVACAVLPVARGFLPLLCDFLPLDRAIALQTRVFAPLSRAVALQTRAFAPLTRAVAPQKRAFAPLSRAVALQTRAVATEIRTQKTDNQWCGFQVAAVLRPSGVAWHGRALSWALSDGCGHGHRLRREHAGADAALFQPLQPGAA